MGGQGWDWNYGPKSGQTGEQIIDFYESPEKVEEVAVVTKLERRNVVLGGFSQGGHMALQAVYGHASILD